MKRSLIPVLVVAVLVFPGLSRAQRLVQRQAPAKAQAQAQALDSRVNSALANVQVVDSKFKWSVTRYNNGKHEIFSGERQCQAIKLPEGFLVSYECVYPENVRVNNKTDQVFLREASFASANGKFQNLPPVFWTLPNHSGWSPYIIFQKSDVPPNIKATFGNLEIVVMDLTTRDGTRSIMAPAVKIGSMVYANFLNLQSRVQNKSVRSASFGKIPLSKDIVLSAKNSKWTIAHE